MDVVRCEWCDRPFPPGSAAPDRKGAWVVAPRSPAEPEQLPGRSSPDPARPGRPGSREDLTAEPWQPMDTHTTRVALRHVALRRHRREQSGPGRGAAPRADAARAPAPNDEAGIAAAGRAAAAPGAAVDRAGGDRGLERLVVAALALAGLPVAVVNPRQVRDFAKAPGGWPRPTRSMPRCWRTSPRRCRPEPAPVARRRSSSSAGARLGRAPPASWWRMLTAEKNRSRQALPAVRPRLRRAHRLAGPGAAAARRRVGPAAAGQSAVARARPAAAQCARRRPDASPSPCSPTCPNWATARPNSVAALVGLAPAQSRQWRLARHAAPSGVVGRRCAPPCTWPPCSAVRYNPVLRAFWTRAAAHRASPRRWPWSPVCISCSPSSMPSSGPAARLGNQRCSPLDSQDSCSFVSTMGGVTLETLKRYVESQKGR